MVETISYARLLKEDLDLGNGTRSVRLQDGSLHNLTQIHLSKLLLTKTASLGNTNGQTSLVATDLIPAGARVYGVTIKITTGLGNGNGLTSINIGDDDILNRWGGVVNFVQDTETSYADFESADMPIYPSASNVRITPNGGTFDGTGAIEVRVHYDLLTHD